jgi:hypothetical protein
MSSLWHPAMLRRRRLLLASATATACLAMTTWIIWLAIALPSFQRVTQWRSVWVGFDVLELAAIATTGWAVTTGRLWAPHAAIATGTLLVSDAWFDVALSWGTRGEAISLGLALVVELPLAAALWRIGPRLLPTLARVDSATRATTPSPEAVDTDLAIPSNGHAPIADPVGQIKVP